jgi:ribosome-binding protein aMBF1 (putative translation factor)
VIGCANVDRIEGIHLSDDVSCFSAPDDVPLPNEYKVFLINLELPDFERWVIAALGNTGWPQTVMAYGLLQHGDSLRPIPLGLHHSLGVQIGGSSDGPLSISRAEAVSPLDALAVWLSNGRVYRVRMSEVMQADTSPVATCSVSENRTYVEVKQASGQVFQMPWDQVLYLEEPNYAYYRQRNVGDTSIANRIGRTVRNLRLGAGMSQSRLATEAGLKPPNISRLETGRHVPSLETLERIAGALGVPVVDLVAERP